MGIDPVTKLEALRESFQAWGPLAPLVYVGLVVLEAVVAPIPGAILYLPGGVIFGGFWGGTLSLAGNTIGAGICCQLMRSLVGPRFQPGYFTDPRLGRAQELILRHGVVSIALLRLNPLTSSDVVSYAAGLTTLPTSTVMLGTTIGMIPLCYLQAYLAMGLFEMFPWLLWPFLVASAGYLIFVFFAIQRLGQGARSEYND
jgi:uncharacterized membrane protein YdjX (TVP38/TMEM64 family)